MGKWLARCACGQLSIFSMYTWDVCVFCMSNCKFDIFAHLSHNIWPNISQQLLLSSILIGRLLCHLCSIQLSFKESNNASITKTKQNWPTKQKELACPIFQFLVIGIQKENSVVTQEFLISTSCTTVSCWVSRNRGYQYRYRFFSH